jgi:hypothetical protein
VLASCARSHDLDSVHSKIESPVQISGYTPGLKQTLFPLCSLLRAESVYSKKALYLQTAIPVLFCDPENCQDTIQRHELQILQDDIQGDDTSYSLNAYSEVPG